MLNEKSQSKKITNGIILFIKGFSNDKRCSGGKQISDYQGLGTMANEEEVGVAIMG